MFAALLLEAGLLLILVPWSAFWDRNYFFDAVPALAEILKSNYSRGAVSGLGVVNLLAGLGELADAFTRRRSHDSFVEDSAAGPLSDH